MVLDSGELRDLSEELYLDARIGTSLYCGRCGYNLRNLPRIYVCPECGGRYDATPLRMRGIFSTERGYFPFGDALAVAISAVSAVIVGLSAFDSAGWTAPTPPGTSPWAGVRLTDPFRLVFGGVFALLAVLYSVKCFRQFGRFLQCRSILRRIVADEGG
jgi:hypothetical protein